MTRSNKKKTKQKYLVLPYTPNVHGEKEGGHASLAPALNVLNALFVEYHLQLVIYVAYALHKISRASNLTRPKNNMCIQLVLKLCQLVVI